MQVIAEIDSIVVWLHYVDSRTFLLIMSEVRKANAVVLAELGGPIVPAKLLEFKALFLVILFYGKT